MTFQFFEDPDNTYRIVLEVEILDVEALYEEFIEWWYETKELNVHNKEHFINLRKRRDECADQAAFDLLQLITSNLPEGIGAFNGSIEKDGVTLIAMGSPPSEDEDETNEDDTDE